MSSSLFARRGNKSVGKVVIGAPVGILGVILPIYTIIDMVETAENVWSDSCVCAIVDKDLEPSHSAQN